MSTVARSISGLLPIFKQAARLASVFGDDRDAFALDYSRFSKALAYLFICAFIANAASFVLQIANPANLVVYDKQLPPLLPWLKTFFFPP